MSIALVNRRRREGRVAFTLLEIMLAVMIMAMMSLAIYRFVQTNLTALRISSENSALDSLYSGFSSLLTGEWSALPGGRGALVGEPLKVADRARDEITWLTTAGPGLATRYATGEYQVTLRMQPAPGTERLEIGLLRRPAIDAVNAATQESWVPLLPDVQSLQIRYFDPRLNTWVDKWTDTIVLPRLVKLTVGRTNEAVPWEAVIALARTPL
jgi:type II secretory pathway pseudopilin PulG